MSIKTEKPSRETVKKLCCIAAMCLMIPVIMINLILIVKERTRLDKLRAEVDSLKKENDNLRKQLDS